MIKEVVEEIEIGSLFDKLNINNVGEYMPPESLKIDTSFGWKKVEGLLKTKENPEWEVETERGIKSCFADFHRLETLDGEFDPKNKCFWSFVKDLKEGDYVNTECGWDTIKSVSFNGKYSQMYDVQVEDIACFYTDGFNSHNTLFMGTVGINAYLAGKKVLVYTFETSDERLYIRYFTNLTNMSKKEILLDEKGAEEKLSKVASMTDGDLIIKDCNANTISSNDIMAHINDLWMYEKWKPDLIIVDYILIMCTNDKSMSSDNSYKYYKTISEELRNIAKSTYTPVLTAMQMRRDAMSDKGGSKAIVTAKDISESRGVYDTVDVFAIMTQTARDKTNKKFFLYFDKNRNDISGIKIAYEIDYEHMMVKEGGVIGRG